MTILLIVKNYPWIEGDSLDYLRLAQSLSEGSYGINTTEGFQIDGLRLPAYPFLILIYQSILGQNLAGLIVLQAGIYLLSVCLIWRLLTQLFNEVLGIIFLLILLPYPFILYTSSLILTEVWTVFLVTLAIYLMVKFLNGSNRKMGFILAAFCLGISFYFRPNLVPLPLFLAFAIIIYNKTLWRNAVLLPAISWFLLVPYTFYNFYVFNKFSPIPVASNTGFSLFLATWQHRVSFKSFTVYAMSGKIDEEIERSGVAEQIREISKKTETEMDNMPTDPTYKEVHRRIVLNKHSREMAFNNIKENPASYFTSSIVNMARMWFSVYHHSYDSDNNGLSISFLVKISIVIIGLGMFILGVSGCIWGIVFYSSPQLKFFFVLIAGCLLSFSLTMCWLHTEARYTIPARLLLVTGAANFVFLMFQWLRNKLLKNYFAMPQVEIKQNTSTINK